MKYEEFLRIYYRTLLKFTKDLQWTPENVFTLESEPINEKYLEQGDAGFFGDKVLSLGAPNEVYEKWFGEIADKYPDYGYLLLTSEGLKTASQQFQSTEDIENMMKILVSLYIKAGLLSINEEVQ